MISYAQALALLNTRAPRLQAETAPLAEALGRTAAGEIRAGFAVPSFDNSAMDGFAVRLADCEHASPQAPVVLPVTGVTAAGDHASPLAAGQAVQIMTGAMLPAAAEAVCPIEDVAVTRDADGAVTAITLTSAPAPGANIRGKGEDFRPEDVVTGEGTRLTSRHLMALAALGVGSVPVRQRPHVSILATGNEVRDVPAGQASATPGEAVIYNSNSPYLAAALREAGARVEYSGIIPDTQAAFAAALEGIIAQARPGQIILSTGAVSKGEFDFVPAALAALNAEILFHRVAIRPGKPVLFAMLPNGIPFFGLPGNPASAAAGFRFFVAPLLRAAWGLPPEPPLRVRLAETYQARPGLRIFLKAHLAIGADGVAAATILAGQESFRIQPMLHLNGWVVRPETVGNLQAGELVDFYPADPFSPFFA
ncbi:molybdopterin molybdenumtransferase MoeA [Acidocella aquatica]|uniref:Molybdopterin molybdenumtransferase n=1 Tax=Acidocella aquatica TaxID=1922313 RepID=A0ABQ6A9J6_9PROT|nr:gephyrin-like molybdotransferase Glp [Acidocella aquatica]GLR67962.1 molybdopterin molybdenumtransferase MoeA [Acidocella aquatica]